MEDYTVYLGGTPPPPPPGPRSPHISLSCSGARLSPTSKNSKISKISVISRSMSHVYDSKISKISENFSKSPNFKNSEVHVACT